MTLFRISAVRKPSSLPNEKEGEGETRERDHKQRERERKSLSVHPQQHHFNIDPSPSYTLIDSDNISSSFPSTATSFTTGIFIDSGHRRVQLHRIAAIH